MAKKKRAEKKAGSDELKWSGSDGLVGMLVPVASLRQDPSNLRLHPEASLDAIRKSFERFGQQKPIVVDATGMAVAGNGQLAAALAMGWTHIAAVQTALDPVAAGAYSVADNRTAELSHWDATRMAGLLRETPVQDMAALGFSERDREKMLAKVDAPVVDEPEVPPAPNVPVSRPGDLWSLGNHRLLCGDCTVKEQVARVMGGRKARLVCTDPPYGVSYVGKTKDALLVTNDDQAGLRRLLRESLGFAFEVSESGAVWYVAAPAGPQFSEFAAVLADLKVWRQTLVWVKDSMVLGHSDYHYKHEVVFYGWKPGKQHKQPPDYFVRHEFLLYGWKPGADRSKPPTRVCTTVLEFDRPKASRDHPTMKPVPLWSELFSNSSVRGDVCYDPFCGSGTSIVVAEALERECCAVEIDPGYTDVSVRRWEEFTGRQATLDGDGRTFAEIARLRSATAVRPSAPSRAPVRRPRTAAGV